VVAAKITDHVNAFRKRRTSANDAALDARNKKFLRSTIEKKPVVPNTIVAFLLSPRKARYTPRVDVSKVIFAEDVLRRIAQKKW
jgi:hypothetical protein